MKIVQRRLLFNAVNCYFRMLVTVEEAFNIQDDSNVNLSVKVLQLQEDTKTSTKSKDFRLATVADSSGSATLRIFKKDSLDKFTTNYLIFTVKSLASFSQNVDCIEKPTACKVLTENKSIKELLETDMRGNVKCRIIEITTFCLC